MPQKLNWSNLKKDYLLLGGIDGVAKKYKCNRTTVSVWKKKLKIKTNLKNYHKYKIDMNFFEKWSPNLAYIVGFIASDGSIIFPSKKGGGGGVRWQIKDLELLKKIRKTLGSSHPIKKLKRFDAYELKIYNKIFYQFLRRIGFTRNKTYGLKPLGIPKKFLNHFIRGYFDGDGSISYNKNKAQRCFNCNITCASLKFIKWLKTIIPSKGGSLFKRKTYYVLEYGKNDTLRLGYFIYKNADIYLDRKYKKFKIAGISI